MPIRVQIDFEDWDEVTHKVAGTREVCGRCDGKGTHVNPAVDGNGLSAEDFAEDPDFAEYYLSGVYDVTCHECRGARVIDVVDYDALSPELKQVFNEREAMKAEDRAHAKACEEGWGW